jgi:hypothetical protein
MMKNSWTSGENINPLQNKNKVPMILVMSATKKGSDPVLWIRHNGTGPD